MLDKQKVITIIKELNLPVEEYLVISGAGLAVRGIRETNDIDIVASRDLFTQLKKTGRWKLTKRYQDNSEFLEGEVVDIASKLEWADYPTTFMEARTRAEVIDGVPFMNLHDLVEFKQAFNRPKDHKDIKLINKYLEANS